MKKWMGLVSCILLAPFGCGMVAQTVSNYDTLVRQGNIRLQTGENESALSAAQSAIKISADRWEAYAVAGGALMNLKRYEEAADQFGHAIDHAPEPKQAGLRDLRKQCLLAEAGASSSGNPAPVQVASSENSGGPSYADTVKWIQEHIKLAGIPGGTSEFNIPGAGTVRPKSYTEKYDDQQYALKINGCSSMDLIITSHMRMIDPDPDPGDNPVTDSSRIAEYRISLAGPASENPNTWGDVGVGVQTDTHAPTERDEINPDAPVHNVEFIFKRDLVTLSFSNDNGPTKDGISILNQTSISFNDPRPDPHYEAWNQYVGVALPGRKAVRISYGKPGTEDEPDHMAKALQHLITLCRQSPDAAPKDIF